MELREVLKMNSQKIALLVDSGIDIPKHIREQYNMYSIPLKIIYKEREYSDGIDITAEEVYSKLSEEIPKTSLPSTGEILEKLAEIKEDGYEKVLIVTLSSGLSGTFNLISMITKEYEGLEVAVIDTRNISIGGGFNAIQAAKYIEQGMGFDELKERVEKEIINSKVFFCIDTLEYLQKGGRIGLVASTLGTVLNLKPIISCNEEGVYYNVAKVRGRKKSLEKMKELAVEFASKGKHYNIALLHGYAKEEAENMKADLIKALPGMKDFIEGQISPALGVHTGPGLVGIGIQIVD